MLSALPPGQVNRFFPDESPTFQKELRRIRGQGYAILRRGSGEISVAVPVGEPPIAGLAASGPIPAGQENIVLARLRKAASEWMTETDKPKQVIHENPGSFV